MSNYLKLTPHDPERIRIVQLTDPHLFATPEQTLLGINTRASLQAVLNQLTQEPDPIDVMVVSGDVSQDHSLASYQAFAEATNNCGMPVVWLPGNHDQTDVMAQGMRGPHIDEARIIDIDNWRLVLVESQVAGKTYGWLTDEQQQLLTTACQQRTDAFKVVFTHHNPLPVGCQWLDQHQLRNGQQLLTQLENDDTTRALVWGHVHQDLDQQQGHLQLLATPSTCVQFLPHSNDFALDEQQPGYRILTLYPDGHITTAVKRLDGSTFLADADSNGY